MGILIGVVISFSFVKVLLILRSASIKNHAFVENYVWCCKLCSLRSLKKKKKEIKTKYNIAVKIYIQHKVERCGLSALCVIPNLPPGREGDIIIIGSESGCITVIFSRVSKGSKRWGSGNFHSATVTGNAISFDVCRVFE